MEPHLSLHDSSPMPTFALAGMEFTASTVKAGGPWSAKNSVTGGKSTTEYQHVQSTSPLGCQRTSNGYTLNYGVDGPLLESLWKSRLSHQPRLPQFQFYKGSNSNAHGICCSGHVCEGFNVSMGVVRTDECEYRAYHAHTTMCQLFELEERSDH